MQGKSKICCAMCYKPLQRFMYTWWLYQDDSLTIVEVMPDIKQINSFSEYYVVNTMIPDNLWTLTEWPNILGVALKYIRASYTQSLANPVRVGHNMATTAMLGKHKTKEYTPCCDPVKPSWPNSVYRWLWSICSCKKMCYLWNSKR